MAEVTLVVTIPEHPDDDDLEAIIIPNAISSGRFGPMSTVTLWISVKTPDLAFVSVLHDQKGPVKGKPYCFNVNVSNNGTFKAGPVAIDLYVNGIIFSEKWLDMLEPGTTVNTTFCWTPSVTGIHNITFVLDPKDNITESNELNNTFMLKVKVTAKKTGLPGFEGSLLVLTIVFVAIALAISRRRRI
jgi:subtilase family serine protease